MLYAILIIKVILELLIIILIYGTIALMGIFVTDKSQIYYSNWKSKRLIRQIEKDYTEFVQKQNKRRLQRELLRKEKEKYPLFYLKEGIV